MIDNQQQLASFVTEYWCKLFTSMNNTSEPNMNVGSIHIYILFVERKHLAIILSLQKCPVKAGYCIVNYPVSHWAIIKGLILVFLSSIFVSDKWK